MKMEVCTWGTGGPFGRELGVEPKRRRRGHTSTSIILSDEDSGEVEVVGGHKAAAHFMIDAGAPSVETMVEKGVSAPDVLFLTHPHFDHISDLDRLANSRMRGLMVKSAIRDFDEAKRLFCPLPVIGTEDCLNHPRDGVLARFGYLEGLVRWTPISDYDLWHSVRRSDCTIAASTATAGAEDTFPLEFKALPVRHSKHAPGSCLFIFRFRSEEGPGEREATRNVVVSGDFKSMDEEVMKNPDLLDPACIVLDANTIRAKGSYHASLEEEMALIDRWCSGDEEVLVLLNHLSGFGDFLEGHYDHVPDDEDWEAAGARFATRSMVKARVAEDGGCYRIK